MPVAMLTATEDTNLIRRGGLDTARAVRSRIAEILDRDPFPDSQVLEALDREFIQNRLSPGGSADLLAMCFFLQFLESGSDR